MYRNKAEGWAAVSQLTQCSCCEGLSEEPPESVINIISGQTSVIGKILASKPVINTIFKAKKNICVFQVSRLYLGFCPDPIHFIVDCEQNVVKFAGKCRKMY